MQFIHLTGAQTRETDAVILVSNELGIKLSEKGIPVKITEAKGKQHSLAVKFKNGTADVEYIDIPSLLRALKLLSGALEDGKSEYEIKETRQFDTSGAMFDCSRNAVINVCTAKYFLRQMAVMGFNTFMLYTEDTYEIESEPYFGYMRGRYSLDEIREIDDYAYSLGIEVIPCIQTLAHLEQFLKWQAASAYRDTAEVLLCESEPTYTLIEKMLTAISSAVRSKRIHIGMDEAHTLGLGGYLDKFGYKTRIELMQKHTARVKAITDRLGLKPMMWGDMLFRLYVDGGGYYDQNIKLPDDAINIVPDGIELIYWDYYHQDKEFYRCYINWHKKFGHIPVFGGGICTWTGAMVQNYNHTVKAADAGLTVCKEEGIRDVFTCIWNDNGGECNYLSVLPGLVRYAEHTYNKVTDSCDISARIKLFTGIDEEAWSTLCAIDCLDASLAPLEPQNPSKYLLWQDPLLGLFDRNAENIALEKHYSAIKNKLSDIVDTVPDMYKGVFNQIIKLCSVLEVKAKLGLKLKAAYDSGDREQLENMAVAVLPDLIERVTELHKAHCEEWFKLYKPFGWEVIDLRYGGLETRLKTAISRIDAYLKKEISSIDELVPKRLTFDGREKVDDMWMGHFNQYHFMVTPNCLG